MRKLVVHALGAHLDLGPERQQSASRPFRSPVASVLGSLLVRVRLLPRAAVVGPGLGVSCCHWRTHALHCESGSPSASDPG